MILKFTCELLFSTMDMIILYKSTLANILTYQNEHILPLRYMSLSNHSIKLIKYVSDLLFQVNQFSF